ncbi:MAG: hypothetical protein JSS67_04770 [Bacteroidetes bacterium]|nr:hypothetical protein [Bacteroidota bacterium]
MKKLLLVSAIAIGLCSFNQVKAQDSAKAETTQMQKNPDWKAIKEKLNLTDDQVTKIKSYASVAKTRRDAVKSDQLLTDQQRADRIKNIKDELKSKIASVLTADQKAKIQAYRDRKEASPLDAVTVED